MSYTNYKVEYLGSSKVLSTVLSLPFNLVPEKVLSADDFGCTVMASDAETGRKVAIKKIIGDSVYELIDGESKKVKNGVYTEKSETLRLFLEIKRLKYLQKFSHPNLFSFVAILPPETPNFDHFQDIYMVYENFGTVSLEKLLYSGPVLSPVHYKAIILQILRGVSFLHSCGIFGQDLCPSNIFVNEKTEIKMCDFNLLEKKDYMNKSTSSSTTSYQSPEMLLGSSNFDGSKSDMWSIGIIILQLISGRNLFAGSSSDYTLIQICQIFGTPTEDDFPKEIVNSIMKGRLMMIQNRQVESPSSSLSDVLSGYIIEDYPEKDMVLDLLTKIFRLNPSDRITPAEALQHPFFKNDTQICQLLPEVTVPSEFSKFSSDLKTCSEYTSGELKARIYEEIREYYPHIGGLPCDIPEISGASSSYSSNLSLHLSSSHLSSRY